MSLHRADRWLAGKAPRLRAFLKRRVARGQWSGLTLTVAIATVFLLLYAFAVIVEGWIEQEALYRLDRAVHQGMQAVRRDEFIGFMKGVTVFGATPVVLALALLIAGVCFWKGDRWAAFGLALAVGIGSALLWGMKGAFGRARPDGGLAGWSGHSFPSGHTFMATVLYGYLAWLAWKRIRPGSGRVLAMSVLAALVLAVGVSRIVLRVHWVSDVAGGLALGLAWLGITLIVTRALEQRSLPNAMMAENRPHIGDTAAAHHSRPGQA